MANLSGNTQAILLLTAPLINGKIENDDPQLLSDGAYRRLARWLHGQSLSPADLLGRDAKVISHSAKHELNLPPLKPLLERGFQLSQAIERWSQRGIWVASRADASYPQRFKERLGDVAPPVIYGCGDAQLLGRGGLAIVGSRNASQPLLSFTIDTARQCAESGFAVISGGARGVDQAAMQGAGAAEGQVIGVLADSLERAVIKREHRDPLMNGSMVLCTPYDPQAGFNVGHAMQRNKLVYALSDAALIVNADFERGGTWAGAVEQLEIFKQIPIYVRQVSEINKALGALMRKGANLWPDPTNAKSFNDIFSQDPKLHTDDAPTGLFDLPDPGTSSGHQQRKRSLPESADAAAVLEKCVQRLILQAEMPLTEDGIATQLAVTKPQARTWLKHLCEKGLLVRRTRPVRYEPAYE